MNRGQTMDNEIFRAAAFSALASAVTAESGVWTLLVPAGNFEARDGRKFVSGSKAEMEAIVARTRQYHGVTDIVVDYDHQSVFGAKDGVGGTAKAAGWIKQLEVRDDGIWGRIEWTPAALEAIRAGEYRYLSPVIPHRKDGRILIILNAALTNTPALNLTAAAASALATRLTNKGTKMDRITEALGLAQGSGEDEILVAIETLRAGSADPARFVPIEVFREAVAEGNKLRQGVTRAEAERHVLSFVKSGHITPFMKDWAIDLCTVNKAKFDDFVAGVGPSISALTASQFGERTMSPGSQKSDLTDTERATCAALGLTADEFNKARSRNTASE